MVLLLCSLATCHWAGVPGAPGTPPAVPRAFPCSAFSLLLLPCSTANLTLQLLPPPYLSGQLAGDDDGGKGGGDNETDLSA